MNITYLELIVIAQVKRLILDPRMKAGDRLHALETITSWARSPGLTVEMLEAVEPASDTEMEMIDAARELDPHPWPPDRYSVPASFDVLSDSFEHFKRLNRGIAAAIEHVQKWETAA
jgi:hypothetical protein